MTALIPVYPFIFIRAPLTVAGLLQQQLRLGPLKQRKMKQDLCIRQISNQYVPDYYYFTGSCLKKRKAALSEH